MTRKSFLFVALASMALVTSCSQDDLQAPKQFGNEIGIHPSMGLSSSRAVETTISNLGTFKVTAFQEGKSNYMNAVKYTSTDGSTWSTADGKFYWPVVGDLHFYGYAPDAPGQAGTLKLDKDGQMLTNFVPNTAAADQKDFVYAKATGNLANNGSTGIGINFQHALSEITICAKNSNTAYKVEVTGVRLGNIINKGTFTFPSTSGGAASWSPSNDTNARQTYTTTWNNPVTLGGNVSTLDAANVPFMLIPQQLQSKTQASTGSCIALKVKITMQGGDVITDGWCYVGIDTKWEMDTHYNYTLDFTNGAGQNESGSTNISGTGIKLNVSVTGWSVSQQNSTL